MASQQKNLPNCFAIGLVLLASLWPSLGFAIHENDRLLTLDTALKQAVAGNPGLAEIKARAEALAAVPPQAGSPPDPTLSVEMLNLPVDSFDFRREDMSMVDVGVSQTVPFPGKLDLQERAAQAEALAAAESVEEARLKLLRDVKLRWWQLFYMERTLQLLAETERVLRTTVKAAEARYSAGEGGQEEVLKAQLELAKLGEEKLIHTAMHHTEAARLNALLDRPPTEMVYLPHDAPAELPAVEAEDRLDQKAEQTRPLLKQKRSSLDAARSRVELAEKDIYPDLTVSAGYAFRDQTPTGQRRSDFLRFGLSVNVPVYAANKQLKMVDQRQSEWLKEQYDLQDTLRKVQGDIASSLAEYQRARDHHRLLKGEIIPLADKTIASLDAGYRSGRTSLGELLRAMAERRNFEMQSWLAYTQAQQALARLTAAAAMETP